MILFTASFQSFHGGSGESTDSLEVFQNLSGDGTDQDPYQITSIEELNAIRHSLNSTYIISEDIDASATQKWNSGKGFKPIGNRDKTSGKKSFEGEIRGKNNTITDLMIDRPERSYTGLLGHTENSVISNLDIIAADVSGSHSTGILAGETADNVTVRSVEVTGEVKGGNRTGGMIGNFGTEGEIHEAYSNTEVKGNRFVGGLTGYNQFNSVLENSYSISDVTAEAFSAGGLSGRNEGLIANSSSNSTVKGVSRVGGLVGDNVGKPGKGSDPIIRNSYSDSWADGREFVGLFVGFNGLDVELLEIDEKNYEVRIENSYYRERKNVVPVGREHGDYTDLSPIDRKYSFNNRLP